MKKVLLLTKDVKQWLDKFQLDVEFDRVRRIRKLSNKDMIISNGWLEVRILDSFWRDNLRGYKCDVVILDMAMEMDDWEMFKYNAKEIRFGERANYLLGGKKIAPLHGAGDLLEVEPGLRGTLKHKDGEGIKVWNPKLQGWTLEREIDLGLLDK